MRVLVCGADGFVGRHLVAGLVRAGHHVRATIFERDPRGDEIRMDMTDPEAMDALPDEVDAVVNAAGVVNARVDSARMYAVNVEGTRNLLRWAERRRVRHFVQISSVAVYGPLVLGERRRERTPRMGLAMGLPYMRSKALAELCVERGGVPYSILRPPAIVGAGDRVVSAGFYEALSQAGLPLLPGARVEHRVALAFAEGLGDVALRVLEQGPLQDAIHVVDAELSLAELGELYASALRHRCRFTPVSWRTALERRNDLGFSWLAASARFGQHYCSCGLSRRLGYRSQRSLESAVTAGLSGLQGGGEVLF